MGFTEVVVVWAGVVDEASIFSDDNDEAMDALYEEVRADAADTEDLVEIYSIYHAHAPELDCECSQYLTNHLPDWSNQE